MQTSPITGASAAQAAGESNGAFRQIAGGEYEHTFSTKAPASFGRTVTHSTGAYGSRNLGEFDLGTQYDDDVFHFVPDGSKVTVVRDVVRTATCNSCHHDMGFHGGSRKTMELCVLCHTPQTWDPDTINTMDMTLMIHKIHMGRALPSVRKGGKYQIIGNRQAVHDYSHVPFVADPRNCGICHETSKGATQAANVFRPSRDACGACHDDVNFATGEGRLALPQVSDQQCANCHFRQGELDFDASILGAHTIPRMSGMLAGTVPDILAVDGGAPGKRPTITFTIKDKSGKPVKPSEMARLNFRFAGPSTDYQPVISEDARRAEDSPDGRYYWTFSVPIPAGAQGTWAVGIEGRREVRLLEGTKQEQVVRDTGLNKVFHFSVDGTRIQPRRKVVATGKCNACHGALAFHGDARNTTGNCVLRHSSQLVARGETVDFRMMIHKIHMGSGLSRGYAIGNANFSKAGYPGLRNNCEARHVNGSQNLPLQPGLFRVADPKGYINPAPPETAACLSCHDTRLAASHALANITAAGEGCAACHGPDADFSVSKVHSR